MKMATKLLKSAMMDCTDSEKMQMIVEPVFDKSFIFIN